MKRIINLCILAILLYIAITMALHIVNKKPKHENAENNLATHIQYIQIISI